MSSFNSEADNKRRAAAVTTYVTYHVQQPKTLESLALKEFVKWIISQVKGKLASPVRSLLERYPYKAEEFISRRATILRNHIECRLPGIFHDKAMVELMEGLDALKTRRRRGKDVPFNLTIQILEILFTKNLTSLTFQSKRLDSEGSLDWLKPKFHLVSGLTKLTLRFGCTNNILECVANNCKLIETLDLYGSKGIKNSSIGILVKFNNLKSINLHGTSVNGTGIVNLLARCPNIERLESDVNFARVLYGKYANSKGLSDKRFNLKYYNNSENKQDTRVQQFVAKVCPKIEELQILKFHYLSVYYQLQNLSKLYLSQFDFFADDVKKLLEVKGSNLVTLHFHKCSEMTDNALRIIFTTCPKLENLSFDFCMVQNEIWNDADFSGKDMTLKYVKNLTISNCLYYYGKQHFFLLIYNCPNVEHIDFCAPNDMTGGDVITDILEAYPNHLRYLKKLKICGELSESLVKHLVQNCVNPLEVQISDQQFNY